LEMPLCTLATEKTAVDVPGSHDHAGASNTVCAHGAAKCNSSDWARASDRLGDCVKISSNADLVEVMSRTANTPHGTDEGATIIPAIVHVHSHDCSFDEICLSPGRVQCVLYRPDGTPLMLGPQADRSPETCPAKPYTLSQHRP
jgi:hypothetical protein